MARLLDDLLDVARFGRGSIEYRKEVVDISELADEVLEAVRYEIEAKDQILHATVCDGQLPVFADPARIKQAQVNLLVNASKYTSAGGDIWYDVDREGHEVLISVRDSGEGIRPELLDSIFDLFVQSEKTLARSSGGMGVGLSLGRTIIEAHGGQIMAESDGLGQGSTFRIRLPITDKKQPRRVPPPHFQSAGRKLLLVEDNDDARLMLAKTLRLQGFEVADAADGQAALSLFASFRPDAAVIDIGLPVMDGYQLAREIRQRKEFADTLLVALTGYGRQVDREAAEAAGFDAHLVKPLKPTDLYELVSTKGAAQHS
jgi:two-component system CheB/CheR fusion protein